MSRNELADRHKRLQRKLSACYKGWHSGRVDRLEESLRTIERELGSDQVASQISGRLIGHEWLSSIWRASDSPLSVG